MKIRLSLSLFFLVLLLAVSVTATPGSAQTRPDSIRVVMDNNYPPYVFQNNEGVLQGILIDQWRLWEKKTGIPVTISALDWDKALQGMKAGKFDVIDTIFRTDERSEWLDFSGPYARLEVPIFFNREISGITDADSLKGFIVAAKTGDNAVDILKRSGVSSLLLFNSYEEVVRAAKDKKAVVFVVDKPPALYFLHKFGISGEYRQSPSLYTGEFHRAVRKGNGALLSTVEAGFSSITAEDLKKIEDKWNGAPLGSRFPTTPFLAGLGGLSLLVLILFAWNRTLKSSVEKQTSELKSTEEILRRNEEKFRAFFEQGYYLAGLMETDGALTDVNDTALQFIGVEKESVIGKPFWETPWWSHSPEIQETLRTAIKAAAEGTLVKFETTHPATDGTLHTIDFSIRPVRDRFGRVIFLVPEGRDISERKKGEEERLGLERQLLHAQKLESLGILSGGIAHDFNNLLLAVLGNLDLALMKLPPEIPARNNIGQAIKAARHAAKLTNMMLAYSGKALFIVKPLNLTELVEENATMWNAAIPKSITLEQQLEHTVPIINADAGQLQQVIMNLITNAAEAIGEGGGTILLATGSGQFDQSTLDESRLDEKVPPGCYVWLEVRDSGCGMDEETLHKLFDPFFTTKFTGRGLGMSAVLGIIRAHKGAFLIKSLPGEGTTIRVLFPASVEQPAITNRDGGGADLQRELIGHNLKVLVIDDEEAIRSITDDMLSELGFETVTAASGEEGAALFARDSGGIDIVLLDQIMPGIDGVSTFKKLRTVRPDIKVILASGFSQQEVAERFSGLGLNGFLPKPYVMKDLATELVRVLKGSGR